MPDFLAALVEDALAQVSMLAVSLVIFALIGAVLFAHAKRRASIDPETGLWKFLVPVDRYRSGQLRVDLWMLIKSRLLWFPIINAAGVVLLTVDFNALLVGSFGSREPLIGDPAVAFLSQFAVTYISLEFSGYWAHRVLHTNGFLWATHRAHHSAEVLTFLVGGRGHPLEHIVFLVFALAIGGSAGGGFLFVTGTTLHPALPVSLIFLGVFAAVMDKFLHSELPVSYGIFDYLFMSARMHRIHHSAEVEHRDKNFGGTLAIFDWLFGTAYRPAKDEQFRLGLSETEIGERNPHQTLKALYLEPFILIREAWDQRRERRRPEQAGRIDPNPPARH